MTMKRLIFIFAAMLVFLTAVNTTFGQSKKPLDNVLTDKEVKDGWKLLFDGKTSAGWMNAKSKSFPSGGWEIKE